MSDPEWKKPVFIDPRKLEGGAEKPFEPRQAREFDPASVQSLAETDPTPSATRPSSGWGWRRAFLLSLTLLLGYGVGVEISRLLRWSFAQHELLGGLFLFLVGIVAVSAAGLSLATFRSLKQVRRCTALRQEAGAVAADTDTASATRAIDLVRRIEKHCAGGACGDEFARAVQLLDNQYNGAEMIAFLSRQGLLETDRRVETAINEASVKTGLLIALSPLVSLDLLIVVWSNRRMLRAISREYGIAPSLAAQYRLLRWSMIHLGTVGLSEMALDTGSSLLGDALTGRLSLRAGQGVASALLTARLGYQAQALCRPLPFSDKRRPPLSQVRDHLLARLKGVE